MNQEEKYQEEYDEVDLMDYLKIILKRKFFILALFVMAVAAAGVFSFFSVKVYKIDTVLEVGKTDSTALEDPVQLVEKLKAGSYRILVMTELKIKEEGYSKVKETNPKGTNLIIREIESSDIETAKLILEKVNGLILEDHEEKIKVKKGLLSQNIKTIEGKIEIVKINIEKVKNKKQSSGSDIQRVKNKIETLRDDIESTRNKIEPLRNDITRIEIKIINAEEEKENLESKVEVLQQQLVYEQTPGTQFALFDAKEKLANKKQEIESLYLSINSLKRAIEDKNLQINSLERSIEDYNSQIGSLERGLEDYNIQINSLEGQIGDYQAQINSLKASLEDIKPTEIIKSPTVSENPVKPRPLLNMAIAGVLGLFVGIFAAFGREWWEEAY
jgi:polysaccharide biosynthesis transport protein